jgi:hypothetical protein
MEEKRRGAAAAVTDDFALCAKSATADRGEKLVASIMQGITGFTPLSQW